MSGIRVPAKERVRFRVEKYYMRGGDKYTLIDQEGCQWVNGRSFGFSVSFSQYPSVYTNTEVEAWAHLPKENYEILPPDTPLWRIDFYEPGARSGIGYYRYHTLTEPDLTQTPIVLETLDKLVIIPDIQRFTRCEVRRV